MIPENNVITRTLNKTKIVENIYKKYVLNLDQKLDSNRKNEIKNKPKRKETKLLAISKLVKFNKVSNQKEFKERKKAGYKSNIIQAIYTFIKY